MKKMSLFSTATLLFTLVSVFAVAQTTPNAASEPKYTLALHPFYLLNYGMRFDLEKRIGTSNNWIQLGPTIYTASRSDRNMYEMMGTDGNDIRTLGGGGLNIGYKSFFTDKLFYWQAGMSYTHYAVKYQSSDWTPVMEDKLTYFEYGIVEHKQNFNKIGTCILIGSQTSMKYPVFADGYLGVGYNYSFYNADKAHFDSMYGFGHRGFLFVAGIRLGFAFGKTKGQQD